MLGCLFRNLGVLAVGMLRAKGLPWVEIQEYQKRNPDYWQSKQLQDINIWGVVTRDKPDFRFFLR